jgi:ABC-2 type transport system ATP-binding protein
LTEVADVEDLLGRSGRIVTVTVADDVTRADFEFEGVHDLSVDSQVRFVFTGEYDRLIDCLGNFTVLDLEIEEAPLEDVFMRFYETDEGGDAGGGDDPQGRG